MCTVVIGPYIIYSLEHYIDQTTAHMNYIKLLYACTVHASLDIYPPFYILLIIS